MKNLLLTVVLLSFVPRLATAQEVRSPVVAEKVTYSRNVPKALSAFVPRGGKSRFWGASNLKYNGKQVWVHVYDVQKTQFLKDDNNVDGKQESGVDLFEVSKSRQLKQISSSRFSYKRYGGYERGGDYESVGVRTPWLDQKNKKLPIIQVAFQNPNGIYGTITQHAFVVFNHGLSKKAIVQQQFGYGSSNSSDVTRWNTDFGVDKTGLLTIRYIEGTRWSEKVTTYRWKNNYFRIDKVDKKETGP